MLSTNLIDRRLTVYNENAIAYKSKQPLETLLQDEKTWMICTDASVPNMKNPHHIIATVTFILSAKLTSPDLINLIWEYCTNDSTLLLMTSYLRDSETINLAKVMTAQSETRLLIDFKDTKEIKIPRLRNLPPLLSNLILDSENANRRLIVLGFLENAKQEVECAALNPNFYLMQAKPYFDLADLLKNIIEIAAKILQVQSPDLAKCKALYDEHIATQNQPEVRLLGN